MSKNIVSIFLVIIRCTLYFSFTGKSEPLRSEDYDTGQLFLHKLFSYRGVILFPWSATVNDRDEIISKSKEGFPEYMKISRNGKNGGKHKDHKRGKRHTYYQVSGCYFLIKLCVHLIQKIL